MAQFLHSGRRPSANNPCPHAICIAFGNGSPSLLPSLIFNFRHPANYYVVSFLLFSPLSFPAASNIDTATCLSFAPSFSTHVSAKTTGAIVWSFPVRPCFHRTRRNQVHIASCCRPACRPTGFPLLLRSPVQSSVCGKRIAVSLSRTFPRQ